MTQESDQSYRHSYLSNTRRDLLPMWIKVFIWIFFVFGALAPIALILSFFGILLPLEIYGLTTENPLSALGLFIILLFSFKGIVSYGLWTEKDWGIQIAIIDAVLGLVICIFMTLIWPFVNADDGIRLIFRLEIIIFVPYIMKLNTIHLSWAERRNTGTEFEDMIENLGNDDTSS